MDAMKASDNLRGFVDAVAKLSTWALVPLVVITMWDVIARKFIFIQIFMVKNFGSIFESTLLQELEWHFHTVVFCLVLEGLSKYQQEVINTACRDTMWWALVRSDAKQVPAMRELEKKGVTFVKWKQADLDKLKAAWLEVVKEKSASDPLFAKITKSYQAFRDDYSIWQKNAYLN